MLRALHDVHEDIEGILGLEHDSSHFGSGYVVLPENESLKNHLTAIDSELQNLYDGQGQFWNPVQAYETSNVSILNPSTDTFRGAQLSQGDRVLLTGQTDATENGIYIFDTTSTPLERSADADESDDFSLFKTVQILESTDEGISGSTFAYDSIDNPVVGTTNLAFKVKSKGVVGDNSITEAKLTTTLADKINDKPDTYKETAQLVGGVAKEIIHGLGEKYPNISVWGSNDVLESYIITAIDSTKFTILSSNSEEVQVRVVA